MVVSMAVKLVTPTAVCWADGKADWSGSQRAQPVVVVRVEPSAVEMETSMAEPSVDWTDAKTAVTTGGGWAV